MPARIRRAPACRILAWQVDRDAAMTVTDLIDAYLAYARAVKLHCDEALAERDRVLRAFTASFGTMLVAELRPFHLEDWIIAEPKWKSSSTRKAKANQVNAALNWAARSRRIAENPCRGVTFAEAERRPILDDGTLVALIRKAHPAFESAAEFLRLTGIRLSDLCRLRWEGVDLVRGIAVVDQHKGRKKTGKPKVFALPQGALQLLAKLPGQRVGHVFLNARGRPWNRGTLGQHLRRLKKRLGVHTKATLHGIRHQFATVAVRRGVPLKHVAMQLGHSSTAITERYYVHIDGDANLMRAAAEMAATREG